jgi:hypothetical protein
MSNVADRAVLAEALMAWRAEPGRAAHDALFDAARRCGMPVGDHVMTPPKWAARHLSALPTPKPGDSK